MSAESLTMEQKAPRLLHVIGTLDPQYGGPVAALHGLSVSSSRAGSHVTIATLDPPVRHTHAWDGVAAIVNLGPGRLKLGASPYNYSSRLVPWLRETAGEYDLVIVHGIWQFHSAAVWRALSGRVPYYVFAHGALDPWFKRAHPLKHLKKWIYWHAIEARVLSGAAGVLFTSEEEMLLARQSFSMDEMKKRVVSYGIIAPAGDPKTEIASFWRQFPDLVGHRILLFLSRLHEKKGCDLLLRAFAAVHKIDPSLQLVMAGPDGGALGQLVHQSRALGIENRVSWLGMLNGEVKWGALRCADAFVLPSHSENFGVAVVEALACGTPVLISKMVNIWREIEIDGAGIAGSDDLEGTLGLLTAWLQRDASERRAMRARAVYSFTRRFEITESWPRFVLAEAALYGTEAKD